ncbi:MAG: arginine--tRNA ligase [Rhodospirillales bacterium]
MNYFEHFNNLALEELKFLAKNGDIPSDLNLDRATAGSPRDPNHGDVALNAAMVLAKDARMKPRDLAELIASRLRSHDDIELVEVAGPGFINIQASPSFWSARLLEILSLGREYGASNMGAGRRVNIEYVSANPTGPLHVGHGRGAVFGDALAAVLRKAGFEVVKEYYINDAGAQVDILAQTALLRAREALGEEIGPIPDGLYPGDYMIPVGEALVSAHGDDLFRMSDQEQNEVARGKAISMMMDSIRDDLAAAGIKQDVFSSERSIVEAGSVDAALATLESKGLVYEGILEPPKGKIPEDWEERPQTLFRATNFGDDVDRPLKKSDGSWTYFATDIAYHFDKISHRGEELIDVWGADHGGYVKRVSAAVQALTDKKDALDVKLCQLVRVLRDGELVRMSKRSGDFITLREVVDEVGRDVLRFIMLTRKNDAPLDFDLARVVNQSKDNPVFYVQYAHARCCSVLRHAKEAGFSARAEDLIHADLTQLTDEDEIGLIKLLASWPRIIEQAAEAHEPHRVAFYLQEAAAAFHQLWNKGRDDTTLRFIQTSDPEATKARLALVQGVIAVIASGLNVLGVQPAEEM